jgi:hypothetical protein
MSLILFNFKVKSTKHASGAPVVHACTGLFYSCCKVVPFCSHSISKFKSMLQVHQCRHLKADDDDRDAEDDYKDPDPNQRQALAEGARDVVYNGVLEAVNGRLTHCRRQHRHNGCDPDLPHTRTTFTSRV